jgi:Zn-dependent protease with chaperone function
MTDQEKQALLDDEHLRLLRIGYFVAAGMDAFFALFPLIYVAIGIVMALSLPGPRRPGEPSPAMFGLIFVFIGLFVSLFMATQGALKLFTARALGQRHRRTLCFVTAALSCLQMPWGALIGIFTFMVLSRPSVKELFDSTADHVPTAPPQRLVSRLFEDEEPAHRVKDHATID